MEINLKQYLKKFEQLLPYETKVRNAVSKTIEELFRVVLDRKTIQVQGTRVFINGSAALKSEIRIKQNVIIQKIKEKDSSLSITQVL